MRSAGFYSRLTMFLASLLLFSACDAMRFWEDNAPMVESASPMDRQVLGVRKKATFVQSSIGQLDRRNVPAFMLGDSRLEISLYTEGGQVRLIDERIQHGSGTSERNRYYFDDGSFFHYYGQAKRRLNPGENPPLEADIRTRMYFNEKGNLFHHERTIDGVPADLEDGELPATMRRAFALRGLDWADSVGIVDTASFTELLYTALELPEGQEMSSTLNDGELAQMENGLPADAELTDEQIVPEAEVDRAAAATDEQRQKAAPAARVAPPKAESTERTRTQRKSVTTPPVQKTQPKQPSPRAQVKPKSQPKPPPPPPTKEVAPPAPPPAPVPADQILIQAHTHIMLPGTLSSHRIRFQKGSTGATLSASVRKGKHKEYVLRARRGQKMTVTLQTDDPNVYFRVFLDDGDISGQRRAWTGSLPRYDDYHIVVYRRSDARGDAAGAYTISMGIQ